MTAAAPDIPQSGAAAQTWDSAELPAPVPSDLPSAPAPAPIAPPPLSANQLMLQARAAFEQLEWCVPAHDGPWRPSPDTHAQMARHAAAITTALTALLSIPTAEPATIEEAQ